ncbi:MAG: hypothetical protein JRH20_28335 [Deltaproteobacteria bacterium]|nr:hypothetical protein [Deltaproteobacteria bacterium]
MASTPWKWIVSLALLLTFNPGEVRAAGYLVDVVVPAYDSNNPEHYLITPNNDGWSEINNAAYRLFYVAPGDYRSVGRVTITQSGTEVKPRFISLHNNNDLHPGKLPLEQQVNVLLGFSGASYWIVDRLSAVAMPNEPYSKAFVMVYLRSSSQHNIFNRLFFDKLEGRAVELSSGSHNNTIQSCRIQGMTIRALKSDTNAIQFSSASGDTSRVVKNTRILNNEIVNCCGGVALQRLASMPTNYEGTVIDGNHFTINASIYTDGAGNFDPKGSWAYAENAIDLKAGSDNVDNPVIITNNYLWGFRKSDPTDSSIGDHGTALVAHNGVWNVFIQQNVIFDSSRGVTLSVKNTFPYSGENIEVMGNVFESVADIWHATNPSVNFYYESNKVTFTLNTLVGSRRAARWVLTNDSESRLTISCNAVIDMHQQYGARSGTTVVEDNTFYNTTPQQATDGTIYALAADAQMLDFTFVTDRFTDHPKTITVPGVISTPQSPHTCEIPALPTCQNKGWQCCDACGQTAHLDFDDTCAVGESCCEACQVAPLGDGGVPSDSGQDGISGDATGDATVGGAPSGDATSGDATGASTPGGCGCGVRPQGGISGVFLLGWLGLLLLRVRRSIRG